MSTTQSYADGQDVPTPDTDSDHDIVSGFRYLARRESGNGTAYYLTHCPICHADLADDSPARHIATHTWADLELMRARERRRADGGGQMTLPTADPDAPW